MAANIEDNPRIEWLISLWTRNDPEINTFDILLPINYRITVFLIARKQGDEREREKRKRNSNLRFRVLGVTFNWSFKAFRVKFLVSRPIFSGVCVAWSTFVASLVAPVPLPAGLLAPFTAKFNCGWDFAADLAPLHLLCLRRHRASAFNLVKLEN